MSSGISTPWDPDKISDMVGLRDVKSSNADVIVLRGRVEVLGPGDVASSTVVWSSGSVTVSCEITRFDELQGKESVTAISRSDLPKSRGFVEDDSGTMTGLSEAAIGVVSSDSNAITPSVMCNLQGSMTMEVSRPSTTVEMRGGEGFPFLLLVGGGRWELGSILVDGSTVSPRRALWNAETRFRRSSWSC
jgi:hypothetical protein